MPLRARSGPGDLTAAWVNNFFVAPGTRTIDFLVALNRAVNAALSDPAFKTQLADMGGTPLPGSPAEFGRLIAAETEKMAKVIQVANINVE